MKPTVRITGTAQMARNLEAMGKALRRKTLMPIILDSLQPMAGTMKAMAPRASGEMADSVVASDQLSPLEASRNEPVAEVEAYVGPGPHPKAKWTELGNARQAANPFIRPAFDAHIDQAMKVVGERGVAAILKAGKKG